MKLTPALAVLVAAALVAACVSGPVFRPPEVTVTGIAVTGLTVENLDLEVALAVENQNPVAATVRDVHVNVSYLKDGEEVYLGGGTTEEVQVQAYGTTGFVVPVRVENPALLSAVVTLLLAGEVEVRAEGGTTIDLGIVSFDVPFEKTGTISLGRG